MNLLSSLAGHLYGLGIKVATPFNHKAQLISEGRSRLWPFLQKEKKALQDNPVIWVHAASLGEFEQGRPLMEAFRICYPDHKILLSFFSPSGYEVKKDYNGADWVVYLPEDSYSHVTRFLNYVNPVMAIFVKYDYWPTFLTELHRRHIPTYIISAIFRPDQLFFKKYGLWYRRLLTYFDKLFVQDSDSKALLLRHNINKVTVAGDTRFDRVSRVAENAKELPLIAAFSVGNTVLIAGSSWPVDEEFIADYFNGRKDLKLIIAPHEIDEPHLQEIESRISRPCIRYTQIEGQDLGSYDCVIIDCFGLLSSIYRYGDMAYVGGGFGHGLHNTLEATVYGIPVIIGPNMNKFKEAKDLIQEKGAALIGSADQFNTIMDSWMDNKDIREAYGLNAGRYVKQNTGATLKILREIKPLR
ncbi:3-deoxy-D-manno-octulosonic acid transferase [Porphyromonas pogonae]|uniref:3-deoxy-D-manno-octulosonic acid transferase n=1 Tax=Porphyromonas pogonae TaxID=867595 RepID=UPI002E79F2CC|nr:glycosyltransferase N-terminal domain-containing protein [Porphyromonas pogonae]